VSVGNEISPRVIGTDTELYQNRAGATEMKFGPFDLAAEAWDVLGDNILRGIPYVLLIFIVVGTSYYQQRQISSRRGSDTPINPQQQMLLRFLPLLSGVWSFVFPAGLVLYWATSNTFRIGQQAYITRQIYGKETEQGKLDVKINKNDDEDDPKADKKKSAKNKSADNNADKAKASGKSKSTDSSADKSNATKDAKSSSNGGSTRADRSAEWQKMRSKKQAVKKKSSTTASSRVTPKGTQSRPAKPKRKR